MISTSIEKAKYHINNFISSHHLLNPYAFIVNQLSIVFIPSNAQDALVDLEWKKTMNDEMKAL